MLAHHEYVAQLKQQLLTTPMCKETESRAKSINYLRVLANTISGREIECEKPGSPYFVEDGIFKIPNKMSITEGKRKLNNYQVTATSDQKFNSF